MGRVELDRRSSSSNGPSSGRAGATAATLGDKIVLYGGQNYGAPLGDTWTWDGSSWALASTEGPDGRFDAVMGVLDGQIVLFGGENYEYLNDTWTWDGMAWSQAMIPTISMMPAPRTGASVATLNGQLVLFGGQGVDAGTWAWNGEVWSQLTATGRAPGGRGHVRVHRLPLIGALALSFAGVGCVVHGAAPSRAIRN